MKRLITSPEVIQYMFTLKHVRIKMRKCVLGYYLPKQREQRSKI